MVPLQYLYPSYLNLEGIKKGTAEGSPSGGAFFRSIQFEAKNVISPRLPLPADSSYDILPVHHHHLQEDQASFECS